MLHEFWHERWRQNEIGFHQQDINPYLLRHWPGIGITAPKGRVLVPLCGKSSDMLWLLSQGYQVVGVELSSLAVEAFFRENRLQPVIDRFGDFTVYRADGLTIFCGDFFALKPEWIGRIDAVFDRASLVALPPGMRVEYVSVLASLLTPATKILLIAFEYSQQEMDGPPFSVETREVGQLFDSWCGIELLSDDDVLGQQPQFQQRGLSRMSEKAYRLTVIA